MMPWQQRRWRRRERMRVFSLSSGGNSCRSLDAGLNQKVLLRPDLAWQ